VALKVKVQCLGGIASSATAGCLLDDNGSSEDGDRNCNFTSYQKGLTKYLYQFSVKSVWSLTSTSLCSIANKQAEFIHSIQNTIVIVQDNERRVLARIARLSLSRRSWVQATAMRRLRLMFSGFP
jgi:hypothetical protein